MQENHSVTTWLRRLGEGDEDSAKRLWERYGPELIQLSRRKFGGALGTFEDEEDLVQSVFRALWMGATNGRLDDVQGREELWWLLLTITRRKALNRHAYNNRQKRGGRTVSLTPALPDHSDADLGVIVPDKDQPPADLIVILAEEQERLLNLLRDDILRQIALWKMEGHTHDEIAAKLSITPRTVIRKMNLIRDRWAKELKP